MKVISNILAFVFAILTVNISKFLVINAFKGTMNDLFMGLFIVVFYNILKVNEDD